MRGASIRMLAAVVPAAVVLLPGATPVVAGRATDVALTLDPIAAIVNAARARPLVALSEGQQWNEQSHRFRLALVRDPRVATAFDDIVVGFGNARYQQVIDMFVEGEDIEEELLRQVWENTTHPNGMWDHPMYEAFFRAVRDVNQTLQAERQLRVVLADPPIDWRVIESEEEVLRWIDMRDRFGVEVIRDRVLARNRRALLIFGDRHLWRHGEYPTLVSLLERAVPGRVFAIGAPTSADLRAIQPSTAYWPVPSLVPLKDTVLGGAAFAPFYETSFRRLRGDPWKDLRLQDQFDALLYLGPPDGITIAQLPAERCRDARYMEMRLARLALVSWGRSQTARLRRLCNTPEEK